MTGSAAFLRNVPVLAGLSDELLERLTGELRVLAVRAGTWIMREGDVANSLFIIRSGRVDVVDEGPPEALIRVLRRGDVLGELALCGRAPAQRRCEPGATPNCSSSIARRSRT
jgi:NTE family protein